MITQSRKDWFEVLNPWAEADTIQPRRISDRLSDLNGKTIGLFQNSKRASGPSLAVVKELLKEKYHNLHFSQFLLMPNAGVDETDEKDRFDDWVKEVDAVILAFGD